MKRAKKLYPWQLAGGHVARAANKKQAEVSTFFFWLVVEPTYLKNITVVKLGSFPQGSG